MLVYVWSRRNEHVRISIMGLFSFGAPYMPWFHFTISLLFGNSVIIDLVGCSAGHIYYFLDDVFPQIAQIRGWAPRHYLRVSEYFQGTQDDIHIDVGSIENTQTSVVPDVRPVAPTENQHGSEEASVNDSVRQYDETTQQQERE